MRRHERFENEELHGHHGHGHHHHPCGPGGERDSRRAAFGPWGGPPFGGPWGGRGGRGRGRGRAGRGDVRASILALLTERPMHGYEMIREIGERTGGVWKPSPGSVYPTLQMLEDEGVVSGEESGGKRLYSLTDAGREEASRAPEGTEPWASVSRGVDFEAMHEIRASIGQVAQALHQVLEVGNDEQRQQAVAVLAEARKKLYLILAETE